MMWNIELVILSFFASFGFAIVFQIKKEYLFLAGLGGALIRIIYLILMAFIPYRIVFAALAAFFADLYAEILAKKLKTPATVFLYPSIVPLIPGDLFYYTMGGIISGDQKMFYDNGSELVFALIGICVGFVLCSTITIYVRKLRSRNK